MNLDEFIIIYKYMGVSKKEWYPQIIDFKRVFHYKPSILGSHPYFWIRRGYPVEESRAIPWRSVLALDDAIDESLRADEL